AGRETEPARQSHPPGDEEQKMKALSSVSSVMTNELRTPLANLKMSFYSLARNSAVGVMVRQDLEQMNSSIKMMDKTISFLNNLSKNLDLNREWLDINHLLDEVLQTLAPIVDPDVVIVKDYAKVPRLFLDRNRMHTVYGNIIKNALETMPCGGRLRITTTENQSSVSVILEDNSLGMNWEVGRHNFEPFVYTNPDGLGLWMTVCKKIVEAHGGAIKVRSDSNKNAAICIEMPIHDEAVSQENQLTKAPQETRYSVKY
ncbi:MAG: HAMP domain-containing histidine kinase, partial [Firmicutes bacterium]|nr:HAMP domain-containing histidine kinase [Bacillota bacterium]